MSERRELFRLSDTRKTYRMGEELVHAMNGVNLVIRENEFAAILGSSGSGKSTLMHVLGFMDQPTSGEMIFDGQDVMRLDPGARAYLRATKIGFIFQAFNLLPRLSVLKNVLLPASYSRQPKAEAMQRAHRMLERVGLGHRLNHFPAQLSGGERQRVAIARALVNQPRLVLADEPTGNLDRQNTLRIMDLFRELHAEGHTLVLVTHDSKVAEYAGRVIRMVDGRVVEGAPS